MGRRKQEPAVQAARGYPSRRKPATDSAIKAVGTREEREAALLAQLDVAGLRPPRRFLTPKGADALAVWKAVIDRLRQTGRASSEFQPLLVGYCDSVARYNQAVRDLNAKGLTVKVTTISGDKMLRINPAEKIREKALTEIMALAERFGFSPRDNYALLLDQRRLIDAGKLPHGDLFGSANQPGSGGPDAAPQADAPAIGAMDSFDSPPPGATVQ